MENDPFEHKCAQQMFLFTKGCVEIQGFIFLHQKQKLQPENPEK